MKFSDLEQLMAIIDLYEKALLAAFPYGAFGEAFEYWNEARKELNKIKE